MESAGLVAVVDLTAILQWGNTHVLAPVIRNADERLTAGFLEVLVAPVTWCVMLGILILERFLPAKPAQRTFSVGFVEDVLYFAWSIAVNVLITTVYVQLLRAFYREYLSFLTITPLWSLPDTARLVLAVFVHDFVFWLQHYVKHVVPWFWEFHAVHHAQRELNIFTSERYHFVEYLIEQVFNVFLLSMFTVSAVYITAVLIARRWYTRLYHGNVRTNLGVLRYVFVTPQSHRVHHSIEPRHRDKNFGVLFSVWDQIFGTQYRGYDEYPDTGVSDLTFPYATSGRNVLSTIAAQHLYPFARIAAAVRRQTRTPSSVHRSSSPDSKHSPV
jgi:sterol desaturase/sphingolipid hydroxylase (fatty acid hydroxylase superfamily)